MKQHALKEAFLDFTKEKLNRQVDDILSAMRFRGPGDREETRERLIEHLAAQMEKTNASRRKEGLQPLGDLAALATYILAEMVKQSVNMDDFTKSLVKTFGEKATPAVAINVLGDFPWAWRFDPNETPSSTVATGATEKEGTADAGDTPPGLNEILAVLKEKWPEMMQVLGMGECDYDLARNTLVILPSPETIGSVMRGKRRIHEILNKSFNKMNIDILDPGPMPERAGNDEQGKGVVPEQPACDREGLTQKRAFPGGFTEDDERCISEMLSGMDLTGTGEREKTEKRLRAFLYSSMNAQNDIRKKKGQPLLKRVRELPIYGLSKVIASSADAETFQNKAREKFPAYYYKSYAIDAAGPFPWAWKFDPKAKQGKQRAAKDTGKQDITHAPMQVENIKTPPQRETAPVKDSTIIVLRTSPPPATVEEDPEMAEIQRLRERLTMLESVFKQHIHSKVDGSTYIPFDTAAEAIMLEDVAL